MLASVTVRSVRNGSGRAPTLRDVAEAAGVSVMTVSNALRCPDRVSPATRERVLRFASEIGYVPNLQAGFLASGSSRVIGAVLPSIRNSSFYHYTLGLRQSAAAHGFEFVSMIAETAEDEASAVRTLVGLRVAGVVLVGGDHMETLKALLTKAAIPVVETYADQSDFGWSVGYDTQKASEELTSHLIATGRRRIGFVNFTEGERHRYSGRLPGFARQMFLAGLDNSLIATISSADGFAAGSLVVDELLAKDSRLDAILCPTDVVAAGALFECARRGVSVPADMALVGWGNYEIGNQIMPRLTTVEPNSRHMGEIAVELIVGEGAGTSQNARQIDVGFSILLRQSA